MASTLIGNLVKLLKTQGLTDDQKGRKIAAAAKINSMTVDQVYDMMQHGFDYVPERGSREIYDSAHIHYNDMRGGRTHRRRHRRTHRGARKTHRRTHRKSGKTHRRGRKTRRH